MPCAKAKSASEKRSGHKITTLKVSGGGSQSDEAMQITADIFGLTVERPHTYETSGLGAAINAAVGVGLYPDYQTALARMTHEGDRFHSHCGKCAHLRPTVQRGLLQALWQAGTPVQVDQGDYRLPLVSNREFKTATRSSLASIVD